MSFFYSPTLSTLRYSPHTIPSEFVDTGQLDPFPVLPKTSTPVPFLNDADPLSPDPPPLDALKRFVAGRK